MVSIPFSLSSARIFFSRILTLVVLAFRKKVVKALAVYTTFNSTINDFLLSVTGEGEWKQVFRSFWQESYNEFLGAAPNLLKGFQSLNEFQVVDAALFFWQGLAALIMMFWIWNLLRAKGMTSEVEWPEKALLLALWLTLSSLIHGTELVVSLFDQVKILVDSVQSFLPETTNNTAVNESFVNKSVNKT